MDKIDLLTDGVAALPKQGKERESYRMSFQTSTEIIKMIESAVDSEGKRGALKEALAGWMIGFDTLLVGRATEILKEILSGRSEELIDEIVKGFNSDEQEDIKAKTLFTLLGFNYKNGLDLVDSLKINSKVNKTYTLSYAAKKSLVSITEKLSIKKSDAFTLVVNTFCRFTFDMKEKQAKKELDQANVIWSLLDKFSDVAAEALTDLESIYEANCEIFDTDVTISALAYESLDTDTEVEKAIGQFVRSISDIDGVAGSIWHIINKNNKSNQNTETKNS